ncbi:hypothetical protein QUA00_26235 [Microcoleus sp. T2B6]|uniref:hypothetical protein n=1 Tax=Microcoleus sp. T2B6 TaxID=3055424 RepID=UPI002FCEED92
MSRLTFLYVALLAEEESNHPIQPTSKTRSPPPSSNQSTWMRSPSGKLQSAIA